MRTFGVKRAAALYDAVVAWFGSELRAMLIASRDQLEEVLGAELADVLLRIRTGDVDIALGYDGVYGRLSLRPGC